MFCLKKFHAFLCVLELFTVVVAQKNFVLFLADDGGFELGAYNNSLIKTPNLDALAQRGVVFTQAQTSVSIGAPSRSSILTGLPSHQNGMFGLGGSSHFSTYSDVPSLPAILRNNNIKSGLIGVKEVGPDSVYKFDYEVSDETLDQNLVGRNISFIKEKVQQFLANVSNNPFFLVVAFSDPHRCEHAGKYGEFCQLYGDGQGDHGRIPDWTPEAHTPYSVYVPYYLPYSPATLMDLAAMYTAYNRMDQGVGLIMKELQTAGVLDNTLIAYTSDNAIPFAGAKSNLYETGAGVPLIVSSPSQKQTWGQRSEGLVSTLDLMPTALQWFGLSYPNSTANNAPAQLMGKSILPLLDNPANVSAFDRAFASSNLDEITMYYPMRSMRTPQYRLIHNLNYGSSFSLPADLGQSFSYRDILNRTQYAEPTLWFKSLHDYFHRDEWELFDLNIDPQELNNVAGDPVHDQTLQSLQKELLAWQTATHDPWVCQPRGLRLDDGSCLLIGNEEP